MVDIHIVLHATTEHAIHSLPHWIRRNNLIPSAICGRHINVLIPYDNEQAASRTKTFTIIIVIDSRIITV